MNSQAPLVVNQNLNITDSRMIVLNSWTRSLLISGVISDGPGPRTNALEFYTYYGGIVLAASNTYAHGTRVRSSGAPRGPVIVLPGATLGTGDVDASLGRLVLTSPENISPTANLKWGYGSVITNRAKIRLASLNVSGTVYTQGVFTATNQFFTLEGDGSIRMPSTNLSPTVVVTAPTNGAAVRDTDIVRFRVQPADVDGFIERVEFYLDGARVGEKTNAPFSVMLTNAGVGVHWLEAVAFDDDGGSVTSGFVQFRVLTRLSSTISSNALVLDFPAADKTPYTLQVTHDLVTAAWSNVVSFGVGPARIIRYTNSLAPAPTASFYRVVSP